MLLHDNLVSVHAIFITVVGTSVVVQSIIDGSNFLQLKTCQQNCHSLYISLGLKDLNFVLKWLDCGPSGLVFRVQWLEEQTVRTGKTMNPHISTPRGGCWWFDDHCWSVVNW